YWFTLYIPDNMFNSFMMIPLKAHSLDCSGEYVKELSNIELATKITITNNLDHQISVTLPDGMQTEQDTNLPPGASISVNLKVNQKTCKYYRQIFGGGSTTKHYSIIDKLEPIKYTILDSDFKGRNETINVTADYITGTDEHSKGQNFEYWYYVCSPKGSCYTNKSIANADILYDFTGEGLKENQTLIVKKITDGNWGDAYDASKNTAALSIENLPVSHSLTLTNHTSKDIKVTDLSGLSLLDNSIDELKKNGLYANYDIQLLNNTVDSAPGTITFNLGEESSSYELNIKPAVSIKKTIPISGNYTFPDDKSVKLNDHIFFKFTPNNRFALYRIIDGTEDIFWSVQWVKDFPEGGNPAEVTFSDGNLQVEGYVSTGPLRTNNIWKTALNNDEENKIDIIDNVVGIYSKDNRLLYKFSDIPEMPICSVSSNLSATITCLFKEPGKEIIAKENNTLYMGDSWILNNGGGDNPLTLRMQPDGNIVLYDEGHVSLWVMPDWNINTKYATFLRFQDDGNLVAYKGSTQNPVFSSNTFGRSDAILALQQDKNMVIYNDSTLRIPSAVWNTKTFRNPIDSYSSIDIFDSPPIKLKVCIDVNRQDSIDFDQASKYIFGGFSAEEDGGSVCYVGKKNASSKDIGKTFTFSAQYGSKYNPLVKKYVAFIQSSGEISIKNNGYDIHTTTVMPEPYIKEIITTITIDDFPEGPYKNKLPLGEQGYHNQKVLCKELEWSGSDELSLQAYCIKARENNKNQLSIKETELQKCQNTGVVIFGDSTLECKAVK
ncbi:MAG: hypothetical protein ACI9P5_004391, partial [Saprospiraceae bacterium]